MTTFDESHFRSLWRNADEAMQLQSTLQRVLQSRDVSSFDGLGHLLDAILPDDPAAVARIANVLRLPAQHLARLRSSELDPLALPLDSMALLGRIVGLKPDTVFNLVQRDHARFAQFASGVTARGDISSDPEAVLAELRSAWERWSADDASDL